MENKKKLDELKDEAKQSLKKDEPPKKEEVESLWERFRKLEKIYTHNMITSELLDLRMLILEIEERFKDKEKDKGKDEEEKK